jgi:anti-anti-sigma regulatory factor
MNAQLLEEIDAEGEVSVLRLNRGVLSTQAAEAVCGALSRLAEESGRTKLHLDFGRVEYLAPAGLSKLLDLHAQLRGAGGGLRLCNAEGCFELTRLCGVPSASPPRLGLSA